MFNLDDVDLVSLIAALDRSELAELVLSTPDGELRISRHPAPASAPVTLPTNGEVAQPAPTRELAAAPGRPEVSAPQVPPPAAERPEAAAGDSAASAERHEVCSPVLGIFYRSPEPGAPPFVSVGDTVEPETTVAVIEVMKVFTAVPAGVRGVVTEVLVEDRELVEYDQPIFAVAKD